MDPAAQRHLVGQQLLREMAGPFGCLLRFPQTFIPDRRVFLADDEGNVPGQGGEDIVEVVGNAPGEQTDRLQLGGLL